jgi:hypothetical protein
MAGAVLGEHSLENRHVSSALLHCNRKCFYVEALKIDSVKIRVALPATDPPDNAHDTTLETLT